MKPRIAILSDVRTWCWARKSEALRLHLSDQFDLQVAHLYDKRPDPLPKGCDLYNTFEVFQARQLAAGLPYVTGMTAHVWRTWEEQHGPGTVRQWAAGALAFHANSRLLEAEMRELLDRPICYVPNGVDERFFRRTRARLSSSRLVVGWVGKPNPRKGSSIVQQACELAGVELRTVARTHRNALGPEQMREFYQDLHVLAVQSDMDGTPNPALEAAACGVAIVSNRIGNMPEFLDGQNGLLVDRSAYSLASALRELSVNDAVRMGDAARATVEAEWTWQKQAPNYARMWLGALGAAKEAA
jgi:glycosyltransferase involved in cell wall biosynthesis